MNAGNFKYSGCILVLFFSFGLALHVFPAGLPAGKVLWWGDGGASLKAIHSTQTNGVIEKDNEIASGIITIAARRGNGLAVKKDGTVFTFGIGWFGLNNVPAGLSNVVSAGVEDDFCWAIKRDGTPAIWGDGAGNAGVVSGLSNIISIAGAGYRSFLALKDDGTVLGFRSDTADPHVQPVNVGGQILSGVIAMACVGNRPLVVKTNGLVYSFDQADPMMVGGAVLSNVVALAFGGGQTLALKRNGTIVAWGDDTYGATVVPVGLTNVIAIAADEHLSMALKSDGTVVSWGDDHFGQTSVPAGLSKVVAIAAGWQFSLALTTGSVPSSVFIQPHGRLESMARDADLIFKGQVMASRAATNASFPGWAKPHATEFKIISILQGKLDADRLVFWHYTGGPMAWSGRETPSVHQFEVGQSYLVFAAKLDKPEYLYTVPADAASRPDEFRQLYSGGVIRTLDIRPLPEVGFKDAHWNELNLLLNDANPTNQLYAIDLLNRMSLAGRGDDDWAHSDDFKREAVINVLLPMTTNSNEQVANRALACFPTVKNPDKTLEPAFVALIDVANNGPSADRRLNAIGALSGTHFEEISNSLAQLLNDTNENARASAVGLLTHYPSAFSEQALRERSADISPIVRAVVADVIGSGKLENLLPVLVTLFADPVGLTNTLQEVQAGGRANIQGDVHTSAGYALLNFDVNQVGGILKSNISDKGFCLSFIRKLEPNGAEPYFPILEKVLKIHTANSEQEAARNGFHWGLSYWLEGNYGWAWDTLFTHVSTQTREALADPKMAPLLDALQIADDPSDARTRSLYGFYLDKGLIERAKELRRGIIRRTEDKNINRESFGFPGLLKMFDEMDEKHSLKPGLGI